MIEGTVLGFDFGEKRIGVAVGSTLTGSARPLLIVDAAAGREAKWEAVAKLVREWDPVALVVGLPTRRDGYMTDERFSSVVVDDGTGAFDDKSAAVILQQWFDEGSPEREPQDIEIPEGK